MASACAWSVALTGLEGRTSRSRPTSPAGFREPFWSACRTALYQSRDRCRAAISNSGHEWPMSLLTINLSPATLPKAGSHHDLPIVAAILAAKQVFPMSCAEPPCSASLAWTAESDPYAGSSRPRLRPLRPASPA